MSHRLRRAPETLSGSSRILVAGHESTSLAAVVEQVTRLGIDVVAQTTDFARAAVAAEQTAPDAALVSVGEPRAQDAREAIKEIVTRGTCPVIALVREPTRELGVLAAESGAFAIVTHREPDQWLDCIEIAQRRFAQYRDLEGAFGRRATIERANGILMERHSLSADEAFGLLRLHARRNNLKLVEVAGAVVAGHALLPPAA